MTLVPSRLAFSQSQVLHFACLYSYDKLVYFFNLLFTNLTL